MEESFRRESISILRVSEISELIENELETDFRVSMDPSIRYTVWTIFIGNTFAATAQYACIQTQAQRFFCVKNVKSAQKYALTSYGNLFHTHLLKSHFNLEWLSSITYYRF